MSQLNKTNNKLCKCENEDTNIKNIPDEILLNIMSYCTVRDAVNMRMLSSIWRRVSFSMPDLSFNFDSMFQTGYKEPSIRCNRPGYSCVELEYKKRFVRGVTQFIENHEGPRLVSLRVEFCLDRGNAREIDRWVISAVSLGAEHIMLLFSCARTGNYFWQKLKLQQFYIFRFELLYQVEAPKLEYLALRCCALEVGRIKQFSCLKKLFLSELPLGSGQVESIISCFTNLEHLTIKRCKLPDKLHIPSSLQLKFLSVIYCSGAKDMDVSANSLTSFEYCGDIGHFSFCSVPNLRKVYLGSYQSAVEGTNSFQSSEIFPFVETLSIFTGNYLVGRMFVCMTRFTNLKELEFITKELLVVTSTQIIDILKSCTLLEIFHLVTSCKNLSANRRELVPLPQPFEPIHKNLKEIRIGYFYASERSIELVLALLDYAPSLERMVLDAKCKVYYGADVWSKYSRQIPFPEEIYRAKILSRLRGHPKSSVVEVVPIDD